MPKPRVLDVFRRHGDAYRAGRWLTAEQDALLRKLQVCRTPSLGGHLYVCDVCGHEVPLYNSCKDRHCPECQALDQARWIAARSERVLPVGHHHVVFTLPSELRPLARRHPRAMYGVLFEAASKTLRLLAEDVLGARLGVTIVLHTWTRALAFHPHVHCVVTAGGLTLDSERWVVRTGFLFPVARMKAVFRGRVLAALARLREHGKLTLPQDSDVPDERAWDALIRSLPRKKRWVVFIEPPFGRSLYVLKYLGRYTHRVAISNARLVKIDDRGVTFRTRGSERRTLPPLEFIRRFLMHVLPSRFNKIRHFGLYAAAAVRRQLPVARELLGAGDHEQPEPEPADDPPSSLPDDWVSLLTLLLGEDPLQCPRCGVGYLQLTHPSTGARGPP
ncbi:MAG: IS91 family transposase [bacterium]|nr:IS91 family transposase [bacterium]